MTTTYTRTIPIVVCEECKKKLEHDEFLENFTSVFAVLVAVSIIWLIWTILNATGLDFFQNFVIGLISVCFTIGLFLLLTLAFYRIVTKKCLTFYKKDFKRQLEEHPLMREAKIDGF